MTEHILNFSIDVDDDSIIKAVQNGAERQIINDIKEKVMRRIFAPKWYGQDPVKFDSYKNEPILADDAELSRFSEEIIRDVLTSWKSEIIDLAADKLVESLKRTKAWKEKVEDTL